MSTLESATGSIAMPMALCACVVTSFLWHCAQVWSPTNSAFAGALRGCQRAGLCACGSASPDAAHEPAPRNNTWSTMTAKRTVFFPTL
jgi:hypothetical protein